MPIDPAYLSFQAPQMASPMQSIGALMQVRKSMAELAQHQALAEQEKQNALRLQAETEQKNRDLLDANTVKELMGDPDASAKIMRGDLSILGGKVSPDMVFKVGKNVNDYHKELATGTETDLKNRSTALGQLADSVMDLQALGDVGKINEQLPGVIQRLDPVLKALKIDPSQLPSSINSFDDLTKALAGLGAQKAAADKVLATKEKEAELASKVGAEKRAADLAPGALAKQALDITKAQQETTGTQPISPYQQAELDTKGETNPTEASLALKVAKGKAPGASPEDVAAGAAADMALKRLDASRLASRPVVNVNMTPEQASTTAGAIASGKLDPASVRAMLRRQPGLLGEVLKIDPKFDEGDLDKRYQTLKEFTNSSNSKAGGQVTALNVLIHHADLYMETAKALNNGTFKPGNAAYNAVASAFGSAPPQTADLVARFFAGETGKVATGGVPAEGEINGILKNLSSSNSPAQIDQAGKALLQIAGGRAVPLIEQVKDARLDDVVHVIRPDSQEILSRHGFDPKTMKSTGAASGAKPPKGYRIDVSGKHYTYNGDGDPKDLKNYTEVR